MVWMRWSAVDVGRVGCVGWLLACGPVVDAGQPSGSAGADTMSSSTSSGSASTSVGPSSTSSTSAATSSVDGSNGDDLTAGFIPARDVAGLSFQCDIWAQDCPVGMKCVPWANDGGSSWNATRCSKLVDAPQQVDEPCTMVDSPVSGVDDCDYRSMCWNVDPGTLMGVCRGICHGDESQPICDDPCEFCPISSEGFVILCVPTCDPLVNDCVDFYGCYPFDDGFSCAPDATGNGGELGEACEYLNACVPGSACVDADTVPGCDGTGCCSPFCDTEATDDCAAVLGGTVCTPWFGDGESSGCVSSTVGVCALP